MKAGFIIDYETVAATLALAGDEEQAAFVVVFLKELRHACKTHWNTEQQLCAINMKLSDEDKETLKMLSYTEEAKT